MTVGGSATLTGRTKGGMNAMKATGKIDAGQEALAAFNTAAALMTAIPLLICC